MIERMAYILQLFIIKQYLSAINCVHVLGVNQA